MKELSVINPERTSLIPATEPKRIAPAQKLQKEGPKKAGPRFDYKDRIIAGEAIAIMALAVLFYISQAGPIF